MRAFVFSLYITSTSEGDLLSSRGMQSISMTKVAELMGVSLHIEKPQGGLPGVIVGELGGPLYDLVKQITEVLNQTGEILVSGGYPNLGSFVLEALKEAGGSASQDLASIEVVLERVSVSQDGLGDFLENNTKYLTACESISCLTRHGCRGWSTCVNYRSSCTPQISLYFFYYSGLLLQKSAFPRPCHRNPLWFRFTASIPYSLDAGQSHLYRQCYTINVDTSGDS